MTRQVIVPESSKGQYKAYHFAAAVRHNERENHKKDESPPTHSHVLLQDEDGIRVTVRHIQ